ncbi:MAG: aminotransferase class I/II [Deltaproteobacteria bacterium]|nr:MAG: aminotransferase class I/II [Deltaproteobacteria bacterium]
MKHSVCHGGAILAAARATGRRPEDLLDFSSNADSLVEGLTRSLVQAIPYPYAWYPDDGCWELVEALAAHHKVDKHQVLVGNGSSELIFLSLQALRPRKVVLVGPVFGEYLRACRNLGIGYEVYLLDEAKGFALTPDDMARLNSIPGDMLILCTPNNPTTAVYQDLAPLLGRGSRTSILIDTTYRAFLYGTPAYAAHGLHHYASLVPDGTHLLCLQSFTKAYSCPGIRLGYLLAQSETIDRLKAVRAPWMVSRFAELAGLAFLAHKEAFDRQRHNLPRLREALVTGLEQTGFFTHILASDLHFILAKLGKGHDAAHLQAYLLAQGMVVRSCDADMGMPEGYFRMQVRCEEDNHALIQACDAYVQDYAAHHKKSSGNWGSAKKSL